MDSEKQTEVHYLVSSSSIGEMYVLIKWPWVQDLMEHEWFRKECILHQAFDDQEYLDSAYFVPLDRMMALSRPG